MNPEAKSAAHETRPAIWQLVLGGIGVVLYVLVGWLYLGSGLVMPYPWVYGMWGLWIVGLFPLGRVFGRAPAWTPAVAVGALIVWVVVVQVGDWLLGWTA